MNTEEEKNLKREYGKNRYNMSEEKKQRSKEYEKTSTRLKIQNKRIFSFLLALYKKWNQHFFFMINV